MKGIQYLITILVGIVTAVPALSADWSPTDVTTYLAKQGAEAKPVAAIKPYRTFITIKHYYVETTGEESNPIANVKLEATFPNGEKLNLPEGNQYWPIGKGQVQEINRTFEVPYAYIQNHGFKFKIQMVRKGSPMLPCEFNVTNLTEQNTSFVCKVDLNWQAMQRIPEPKMDKEGVQVRVFTDRNSPSKEVPTDAIALR